MGDKKKLDREGRKQRKKKEEDLPVPVKKRSRRSEDPKESDDGEESGDNESEYVVSDAEKAIDVSPEDLTNDVQEMLDAFESKHPGEIATWRKGGETVDTHTSDEEEGEEGEEDNDNDNDNDSELSDAEDEETKMEDEGDETKRMTLFVGNLPYTAGKDEIMKHFAVAHPTSVRILTKKVDGKETNKGCAFVDFSNGKDVRKALKLHHTIIPGTKRSINVELTAGGGGSGEKRKARIEDKNDKLKKQRKKHFEERVQKEKRKNISKP